MKNLIIGVTGSVAAIKVIQLAHSLKEFFNIKIVTTEQGSYFIQSDLDAFKELAIPIYRDSDEWPQLNEPYKVGTPILHIELRRWADIFLIAPLDANTLAKLTYGFCDNLLTSIVRAWDWTKPLAICPAMNTVMWNNPPTAEQIEVLKSRGALLIDPIEKKLACLDTGMGGMAEVLEIVNFMKKISF
ncbi:MAG: phosphopantothenoylcysteine decarboxylase, partial [Gammaproteobacteria bacterium]|nr:phosphopantothenoylcysteine decarboxylase [Gammaproteobacteria bacterium]